MNIFLKKNQTLFIVYVYTDNNVKESVVEIFCFHYQNL